MSSSVASRIRCRFSIVDALGRRGSAILVPTRVRPAREKFERAFQIGYNDRATGLDGNITRSIGRTAMTTSTDTAPYFDPYDVDINADPYPTYERLREEAPAYYNERYDFWALSRHADVEQALLNWQVFTSTRSDILD